MKDENKIEFFIPMKNPPSITQQEHKVRVVKGKPVFFDPPELKAAKQLFIAHLVPFRPIQPLKGPLRLTTKWIWDAGKDHQDGEPKITKPDTDNIVKAFKDCMSSCFFWKDDAQVASEITEKFWGKHPGIYVRIEKL